MLIYDLAYVPTQYPQWCRLTKELTDIEFGSKKENPETIILFEE